MNTETTTAYTLEGKTYAGDDTSTACADDSADDNNDDSADDKALNYFGC